jgi:hypothetical protein
MDKNKVPLTFDVIEDIVISSRGELSETFLE